MANRSYGKQTAAEDGKDLMVLVVAQCGLRCTDKGGNNRLDKGFFYLKKKFILTETGRVLILPEKAKFHKERRALRDMKRRLDAGKITMKDVENHYESWVSGLMICNCGRRLKEMNAYYSNLYRKKPCYKCKTKGRRNKMKHKTQKDQVADLTRENEALRDTVEQQKADMEYLAMMAGVDIDEEAESNAQP